MEVLFDGALAYWISLGGKESVANSLVGDLEEGNGVVDPLGIGWDVPPYAESAPLFPIGGLLLADGVKKPLGDCLSCSIEVS